MQIVSPNETIALISLSTKIGDTTGMINLCIPHVVIEPIMPRLSVHHWFVSQKKTRAPEEQQLLEQRVNKAKLPIIAELGASRISIQEFLNLSVGDVIALHKPTDEGLEVKVGDKVKFIASPGTVRDKMAIQIHEILSEGVDEIHDE
jgi:flagellar motor switch protein FliM